MRKIISILILIFCWLLSACVSVDPKQGSLNPTSLPVVVTVNQPQKPGSEAVQQAPAAIPATEASPIPLTPPGIWLVSVLEENNILLRAINPNGTQMLELGPSGNPKAAHFAASPNPQNPWISLYSSEDNGLTLMRIPTENSSKLLVLLTSKDLPSDKKEGLQKEFLQDVHPAQIWSPDGTRLAYLDVTTGSNTRLMVYDTTTGNTSSLTETSADVAAPVWSPDGQWIIYQTIDGLSSPVLSEVTGVYAVRSNGSETRLLYSPPASMRETILGWSSANTFIVQSLIERGSRDLRLVSVSDGSSLSLNAGLIKNACWDEKTQTALYLLTASETNDEQPSGVYAVTASSPQRMVLPGKWEYLQRFTPSGLLVASMPGQVGVILPDGKATTIDNVDSIAGVSPDGKLLLLNQTGGGLGLFSSDGKLLVNISDKPVEKVYFSPDNQHFFYSNNFTGYESASPDWKPQPRPDFNSLIGWVGLTN
jgi:dipeptidyl aminopeptidase/acylaminoacyl peptidase